MCLHSFRVMAQGMDSFNRGGSLAGSLHRPVSRGEGDSLPSTWQTTV